MQQHSFFPSKRQRNLFILLNLAVVALLLFYFFQASGGLTPFIIKLRLQKIWGFILVALAMSISTIAFQTIVSSHFLTPSILGMQSLYTFIQTLIVFVGSRAVNGMLELPAVPGFILNTLIMMSLYGLIWRPLQKMLKQEIGTLLLSGMVLGTLLSSMSQFMQLTLDPNEFDFLQNRLVASFQNTDPSLLAIATPIVVISSWRLYKLHPELDVFALGPETAHALGINIKKLTHKVFFHVFLLTAVITALVGPLLFLGFMAANITYTISQTFKHKWQFILSLPLSLFIILAGMLVVERGFALQTTFETIVDLTGGIFFIILLLKERK